MKALKTAVFLLLLFFTVHSASAQTDSSSASQRALYFANNLVNAFRNSNWNEYLNISYPGVIRYYGGKQGFSEYVQRLRSINNNILEEAPEQLEMIQIQHDLKEWQCVVKKTRQTLIDGKKAIIISYLVGQSKDEGQNWTYFDVAYNSVENVVYIMPDIFDSLTVPQRKIIFDKDQIAKMVRF
jgi:hypothetical protein